jgi:menaquinone-dependent protoporphyrinogen oxidase
MKALVVYGTRGGATRGIADEIGKTLTEQGYESTVKNATETKGVRAEDFDLVIVDSSVYAGMWSGKAKGFLKKNQKTLASKKVALFSSGLAGSDPTQANAAKQSIEKTAAQFTAIKPVALAYFGGVVNFDSPNFFARIMANAMKADFVKKGFDTSKPIDQRDWEAIRQWTKDVAAKAR